MTVILKRRVLLKGIIGGMEETIIVVVRLRARDKVLALSCHYR
jgi:S-adenosylhomocysteine hydrolase